MNEQNSISTLEPLAKAPSPHGTSATEPAMSVTPQPESWLTWLKRTGPMVVVLALLGSVAYAGHRTGWTVPKFADLFGGSASAKDD